MGVRNLGEVRRFEGYGEEEIVAEGGTRKWGQEKCGGGNRNAETYHSDHHRHQRLNQQKCLHPSTKTDEPHPFAFRGAK